MKRLFNRFFKKKKPDTKEGLLNKYYDAKIAHNYADMKEIANRLSGLNK